MCLFKACIKDMFSIKQFHNCTRSLCLLYCFIAESFRAPIFQSGPDKNGFSLGKFNNFTEVFGVDRKLWFLPVFTRYFFILEFNDGMHLRIHSVD